MNVPLQWVWENDPEELPDDDHARCIAARGDRFIACGGQLFVLTTRPCMRSSAGGGRGATRSSTLQMEYLGLDWPRGLAQRYWGSDPYACGPSGSAAGQSVGIALLETVAGALAAGVGTRSGSAVGSVPTWSPRVGFDDLRQPQRPPGWPPRVHARRAPLPALLPRVVGPFRGHS